jgi:hypothetical protein
MFRSISLVDSTSDVLTNKIMNYNCFILPLRYTACYNPLNSFSPGISSQLNLCFNIMSFFFNLLENVTDQRAMLGIQTNPSACSKSRLHKPTIILPITSLN